MRSLTMGVLKMGYKFGLSSLLIGLSLFACAKQGSVLTAASSVTSSATSTLNVSAVCAAASSSNNIFYPSLSICTSAWGANNCGPSVVTSGSSSVTCYVKNSTVSTSGSTGVVSTSTSGTTGITATTGTTGVATTTGTTGVATTTGTTGVATTTGTTGVATTASLSISPLTYNFGSHYLPYSANHTFVVSNSGTGAATSCVVSSSNTLDFTALASCSSIAAGGTCSIVLNASPDATGYTGKTQLSISCANAFAQTTANGITVTGLFSSTTGTTGSTSTSGCFVAGTQIEMADGSFKSIENVVMGDRVRAANGEVNQVNKLFLIHHKGLKYSFNHGKFFVTSSHPFLTESGWKSLNPMVSVRENPGLNVSQLAEGDVVLTKNGSYRINSVEASHNAETVYNFRTDGDHTYIADGYLVHNVAIKPQ